MGQISVFQRKGKEGGRQEGVAVKVHGYHPTIAIPHKVDEFQVRWAEAQAIISHLVAKVDTVSPPRVGENLYKESSVRELPRCETDRRSKRECLPR